MVSPHGPPFSKISESTSDGIDGPWIVTHIGQGGMVHDWWQSAPGKIAILLNINGINLGKFDVRRLGIFSMVNCNQMPRCLLCKQTLLQL